MSVNRFLSVGFLYISISYAYIYSGTMESCVGETCADDQQNKDRILAEPGSNPTMKQKPQKRLLMLNCLQ